MHARGAREAARAGAEQNENGKIQIQRLRCRLAPVRPSRPPTPPPAPPADTAFGPLTLLERIAVGGMAEVFRAREPRGAGEPRTVVVKRMLPHIAAEPGAARMFEAEARIGRLVAHPNVVRVLAFGEAARQPYLTLELVPGLDLGRLRAWLAREGRALEAPLALVVGADLLAGLHAVHEAKDEHGHRLEIVHGDVSPSNVLLSTQGEVKLADFGIAQARLRASFPQAASSRTRGKLAYLSPEQVRGEANDRRSDVFAAAAVVAELLVGEPLFARESDLSTLLAIRDASLERLEAHRAALPPALFEALARGLAREPEDRPETAAALAGSLSRLVTSDPTALRAELGALVAQASGALAQAQTPIPREEVTVEPPLTDHWVYTQRGEQLGPWTFAQLIEAVTVGRVSGEDRVRAGTELRRIAELDALAAHLPRARLARAARATAPAPEAGATVDLAGGGIVEALARAAAERADGVWTFRRGPARKEVFLVGGTPEFVTSNLPEELLGELLVARGALTRGELEMALAVLPKFDGRLGDTLAALGLMEPVELFRYISEQVKEKLLELFTWTEGEAEFTPGVPPPRRGFPLGLDPWRILLEGIERRLAAGLENDTFAAHLTDDLTRTALEPPPTAPPEVEQLLMATSRPRPLYEIADALADPSEEDVHRPYRAIRLGMALGLVGWA